MKVHNSNFVLIDLQSSWQAATQIPVSAFSFIGASNLLSSTFRRTFFAHHPLVCCLSSGSSLRSPKIRKPTDRCLPVNRLLWNSQSLDSPSQLEAVPEFDIFLELLPPSMRWHLFRHSEIANLIEVVMDLGRKPLARFPSGDWVISEQLVKLEDLQHAISKVSGFSDDNRSGIDRSLHRISAIRNRKMQVIGLTCRVGRAVSGSAEIIRDLVEEGGSILVIGAPGVGKTTLIRDIARMLADNHMKRVVIVDTSNEIGGDGDVPHSGIGRARRMQVPNVNMQHNVMIEAVENHMPEAIIIDEIGTELEALAASTIAQRGVQLIATAHGMTINNIMKNPSLQILVGGIESVTLGDEEAKRRKVQKTILERKGPPTFTCAVEMISRTECRVHHRLDATVDAILAGKIPLFEVRQIDPQATNSKSIHPEESKYSSHEAEDPVLQFGDEVVDYPPCRWKKWSTRKAMGKTTSPVRVYTYQILEADLLQVAMIMGLEDELEVTDSMETAEVILVSSSEMKKNPWIRGVAKFHQVQIFVIKSDTMAQIVKAVRMILGMESLSCRSQGSLCNISGIEIEDDAPRRKPSLEEIDALEEARLAIEYIVIPGKEAVELLPRRTDIIARQLEMVESYRLAAENTGTELYPRLQILPLPSTTKPCLAKPTPSLQQRTTLDSMVGHARRVGVARLPLLPE